MIYIIGEVTKTPDEICGLLIEDCGYNFFNVIWNLPIPGGKPPYQPLPQPPVGTRSIMHFR
jgi:hypothetical protein